MRTLALPSYQNTAWNPLKPFHWRRFKSLHKKKKKKVVEDTETVEGGEIVSTIAYSSNYKGLKGN